MKNRKRKLSEWMDIITECRESGMSEAAWCELNGISVNCQGALITLVVREFLIRNYSKKLFPILQYG